MLFAVLSPAFYVTLKVALRHERTCRRTSRLALALAARSSATFFFFPSSCRRFPVTVVRTHTLWLPLIPLAKPALYNTDQRVNTALLFSLAAGRMRVSSRCLLFSPCRTGAGAAEVTAPQRGDITFIFFDIRSFFSASTCNGVLKITPIP